MAMRAFLSLLLVSFVISGCSSASKAKITKADINNEDHRIIYGKIKDLNPDSIPAKLQMTYTLNDQA